MRDLVICALIGGLCLGCGGGAMSPGPDLSSPMDLSAIADAAAPPDLSTPDLAQPSPDLAGACDPLINAASRVDQVAIATAPPTGMGGVIADGTYYVTGYTLYTGSGGMAGPTGAATRFMTVVAGGSYSDVQATTPMVNEVRSAGTFTINGSAVVIHQSCPMAADTPFTFDGDGIVTTLYSMPINGKVIAYTFTKQ